MRPASAATYIYCLVERPRRPGMTTVPGGLPGAGAPELLDVSKGLWAVGSDVPLSTYGPEQLDARLRDINWVADVAVAHEAVVEHFAGSKGTTVVPMKLFTMFSGRDRALADLRARGRELRAVLKRIRGCQEWGVRVVRRAVAHPAGPRAPSVSSGTAFLASKKRARDDERETWLKAADAAEQAFVTLAKHARATHRLEAPREAEAPPLIDVAFLVPAGRRARFRAAAVRSAAGCRKAGADLVLTGPWPAYNFVQPRA